MLLEGDRGQGKEGKRGRSVGGGGQPEIEKKKKRRRR